MSKTYVDVAVFVPLEEELTEVCKIFKPLIDHSSDIHWRYIVDSGNARISMLLVQHAGMGKDYASEAIRDTLRHFEVGLVICLGIAGGLSKDLSLGDICYTGILVDVVDNSKATESEDGRLKVELSPTYYESDRKLTTAFNFMRTRPDLTIQYSAWLSERELEVRKIFDSSVLGKDGVLETISYPQTKSGMIACGLVSASKEYNEKLRSVDRKILAIETESGALFRECGSANIPTLTIRGISDYADSSKSELEGSTRNKIRALAARNAALFLKLQLSNPHVLRFIDNRKLENAGTPTLFDEEKYGDTLIASFIDEVGKKIGEKLKELSPGYNLKIEGYRLPVPRIHLISKASVLTGRSKGDPIDVRDALKSHSSILLNLPRTYPDHTVPWVIAEDLLTSELFGKQVVPIVVSGEDLKPPKNTLSHCAYTPFDKISEIDGIQLVFIVDDVQFSSKTRVAFLLKEIESVPHAKFIFVARGDSHVVLESEFATSSKSDLFELGKISFEEIAHFVQKSYSLAASESEVIALRLRDTFNKFNLSAYPSYFAGIQKETLSALLLANRRAELIQLATTGFLISVVIDDSNPISLSRTTRERFLQRLVVQLKVEKEVFTKARLVQFAQEFSDEYSYGIDPIKFVAGFVDKGILFFENDRLFFALPFIEDYLLANALTKNDKLARQYFLAGSNERLDAGAFDLYCEIGPSKEVTAAVIENARNASQIIGLNKDEAHILLTEILQPTLVMQPGPVNALRKRLGKAADAVNENAGDSKEKQKILDSADKVRAATAKKSRNDPNEKSDVKDDNVKK